MNHSDTLSIRPLRTLRHWLTGIALSLGLACPAVAITTSSASAASFGDVFVVATAHSNCGSHTITVWPMTNEHLNGQISVYSYAQVYDYVSARWISTAWMLDTGIQGHISTT